MKKLLLMIFISISLFAGEVEWVYDFKEAKKIAKEKDKTVMMFISMEQCPICTYMKEKIFVQDHISSYMNENFIPYYIDVDMDSVPEGFDYYGTPTTYFIQPNGEVKGKITGGTKKGFYLKKLHKFVSM